MKNDKTAIATIFANTVDGQLVREYFAGLGYDLVDFANDEHRRVDLFILDKPSARRIGRKIVELKRAAEMFLPVLLILDPEEVVSPWLDAGFDVCLKQPLSKNELRAHTELLLRIRQQAQTLKRRGETRYRALFENTGTATILMEEDLTIRMANRECLRLTGYSPDEIVGTKWNDYVAPECDEPLLTHSAAKRGGSKKAPDRYETKLINKAGQVRDVVVHVDVMPESNQRIVSMTDITERKQAEDVLRRRESLFSSLFHSHTAVQLLVDPDTGQIIDSNRAATVFYGKTQAQLSQMKISALSVLSPEEIKRRIHRVISGKQTYFESRHKTAEGSVRDVEIYGSKVEANDQLLFCAVIHDITDRKQAEAQKQKLEEQLHQTQKLESVGRLAGGVAHDFNNMLNVILGYGEIVLSKLHQDDPLRDDVKQILEAGKRSAALTRQLLAFSRKQTLQPEVVQLGAIVRNLEKMLGRLIGEDIELQLVLSEENDSVLADPGQIEQVIMNLAVNSRDAMPDGGKLIIEIGNADLDEEYARVHPGARPGRYVLLSLTDTGCGMDKETVSQIFEPFFTTKEKGRGTGLGLSTVYGIVKQSNGSIWVYSEPGHGTTFKIYLPLTEKTPEKEQERTAPELSAGGEHILVVEDEESLLKLAHAILSRLGYQVSVAANGGEALLLFEKEGLKPDLVITDVVMPKMSGKELVERLRKIQPDLKVLYMSGYTNNAISHHGILDPGTPFIQKPFTMRDIADKIQHILRGGGDEV